MTELKTRKSSTEQEAYDSSEEEGEVNITKSGHIEMRQKKIWKAVYCVLFGGSFYYYKNANDPEPKGRIDLEGLTVVTPVKNEKKKHSFALQKGEELFFVGACSGSPELEQWTNTLQDSLDKEKTEAPSAGKKKTKKAGFVKRAIWPSVLGKKIKLRSIVNDETSGLLAALKRMVKTESSSAKKAEDLEKKHLENNREMLHVDRSQDSQCRRSVTCR